MKDFVKSFLTWAAKTPQAPAVMDRFGADSYLTVNQRSSRLAHELLRICGQEKETRVALLLPRNRNYVSALLAVVG